MECGYSFKSQCVNTTRRDLYLRTQPFPAGMGLCRSGQGQQQQPRLSPSSRDQHLHLAQVPLLSRLGLCSQGPGVLQGTLGCTLRAGAAAGCRVRGWPRLGTSGCRQHRERWGAAYPPACGSRRGGTEGCFLLHHQQDPASHPQRQSPQSLSILPPKTHLLPSAAQALQTQRYPGPATAQPCVQRSLGPCKITSSPNELARQRAEAHKAAAPEDESAAQCQAWEAAPAGASHRITARRGLVRAVPSPAGEKQLHLLLLAVVRALCELAGAELHAREVQGCPQGSFSHPLGLRGGRSPTRGRQHQAVVISPGATHLQ